MMGKYDEVKKDQIEAGIVERVSEPAKGMEFYIPHKAVVQETAKTTILCIVYDASTQAWEKHLRSTNASMQGPCCRINFGMC